MCNLTGFPPRFWLALAHVYRTGRTLHEFDNLADAAMALGYADQAHMTRDPKRWLGVTPCRQSIDNNGTSGSRQKRPGGATWLGKIILEISGICLRSGLGAKFPEKILRIGSEFSRRDTVITATLCVPRCSQICEETRETMFNQQ